MRQVLLRRVIAILVLLVAVGAALELTSPHAEASFGHKEALTTIGISAGIGTVIGLSTIAFYDTPTAHFKNALVGTGAGLIVGLGLVAYLLTQSADEDEISPEEVLPPENKPGKKPEKDQNKTKKSSQLRGLREPLLAYAGFDSVSSVAATAHNYSPQWAIGLQVLELRF